MLIALVRWAEAAETRKRAAAVDRGGRAEVGSGEDPELPALVAV